MTYARMRQYLLRDHAKACGLPWVLVEAIVAVESGGNPHAWRAEPHYRYFWDCGKHCPFRYLNKAEVDSACAPEDFDYYEDFGSRDTEWYGQQASWGPMLVMGAVARERGFDGWFTELCSSDEGIYWGCRHLQCLVNHYYDGDGWPGVISAYNQGSPRKDDSGRFCNQGYVDMVLAQYQAIVASAQVEELHAPAA